MNNESKINKLIRKQAGFTMIELIVSIAIIGLMSATFLMNYRDSGRRTEVIFSAQSLVSSLRSAQNNTLGSVEYNGQVPKGGWGVHFDLSSSTHEYYIFADVDQNLEMDLGEYETEYGARRIDLPEDVSLASTTVGNQLDITFLPPDPMTIIWDGVASSTMVRIELNDVTGSKKKIEVNFFGLIEVSQ